MPRMNKLPELVELLLTRPMLSHRDIARHLALSRRTVDRYRHLLRERGHTWEQLRNVRGKALNQLFNREGRRTKKVRPDFPAIDEEMRQPGATLLAVWEDYRAANPAETLAYAQYAALYRRHAQRQDLVMRQAHPPGRSVMVDYSGKRPHYTDRATGTKVPVELFVSVLGSGHYIFACCSATQTVPDWIEAHNRMLAFYGAVPAVVVPDNLRSAVSKSGVEPVLQRAYADWARHHGMAVLPARPGHPRDKGAVEGAVLVVQRFMLRALARQTFFSLAEVDAAVVGMLTALNHRPFQKRAGCRRSAFETVERPAMRPLPAERFVYSHWTARQVVPRDYHVGVLGHFYSVPHALVGLAVEARVLPTHIEVFHDSECVARHPRGAVKGGHTIERAHQPEAHRAEADRTPEGLLAWAQGVGPHTYQLACRQFDQKVPLQGLPACVALRNLGKDRTPADLEAAAGRALGLGLANPTGLRRMLESRHVSREAEVPTTASRRRRTVVPLRPPVTRRRPAGPPTSRSAP